MCLSQQTICLLCLRCVTPTTTTTTSAPDDIATTLEAPDDTTTTSVVQDAVGPSEVPIKVEGSKRIELSSLCQIVHSVNPHHQQHQSSGSVSYNRDNCTLCPQCSELEEEATDLYAQVNDLQGQLRAKINLIKTTIINSDYLRDQLATNSLIDQIAVYRQTLLTLADEEDVFNPGQVQVKVKIEEEDDLPHYRLDGDEGAASPSAFFVQPELPDDDYLGLNEESEDGECPLFIQPLGKRRTSARKRSQRVQLEEPLLDDHEHYEEVEPMRKRRRRRPRKNATKIQQASAPGRPRGRRKVIKSEIIATDSSEESSSDDPSDPSDVDMALEAWINSADDPSFSSEKRFKCEFCDKAGYISQSGLDRHLYEKHGMGDPPPNSRLRHICEICDTSFRTSSQKSAHLKDSHPGEAPNQCGHCSRKFYRKSSLETHLYMHHENDSKPLQCHICQKTFTLEDNLKRHVSDHANEAEKQFYCEICDTRFKSSQRFERHSKTHSKSFTCEYCQHSYSTRTALSRHVRTHTGEKPYVCDVPDCGERFIDGAAKNWHAAKVHTSPEDHALCPVCGKTFFSAYILKAHLDRHSGKGGVSCEICNNGVRFNDAGALKTHKIQHHGAEPLICDECGVKFMTNKGLKQHKMSHKGEKPFECSWAGCDARFLSKWVLANHMRSHTGERPFVCDKCGKGFKAKKHLDTHVKSIHSEDYVMKTPFKCPHCPKAYPRRGILDGHIRQVHTGERPFTCEHCNKGFALKTTLRLHLKSHGIEVSIRGQRLPRSKREKFSPPPSTSTGDQIASTSTVGKSRNRNNVPSQQHLQMPIVAISQEESMATTMSAAGSVSSTPTPTPTPRELDNCSTQSSILGGDFLPQNLKFMHQQPQHLQQGTLQGTAAFFNQTLANYYQL